MTSTDPQPGDGQREFWRSQAHARASQLLSAMPARYRAAEADHPTVTAWVSQLVEIAEGRPDQWVEPFISSGPSLLLVGKVGTGKTWQAWGAVRALLGCGIRCNAVVITAADLYARMRPRHGADSEAEFERVAHAGVLVLDDIGAAKGSEWVEEVNYRLINCRYERQTPTLVTSNVPPAGLPAALGERVASRLGEMATTVLLKGPDRRRGSQ